MLRHNVAGQLHHPCNVRAISLKQPWANMIVEGLKTVETRVWATRYRGTLVIVSSKRPDIAPAGFALAVADLVDCRPMMEADTVAACCEVYPRAKAWVLDNVHPITPIAVTGQLGLYRLPEEMEQRIREELRGRGLA